MKTILALSAAALLFAAEPLKVPPPAVPVGLSDMDIKQIDAVAKHREFLSTQIRAREQEARAANAARMLFEIEDKKVLETQRSLIGGICANAGHKGDCDQWLKAELERYMSNSQKRTPAAAPDIARGQR